MMLNGPEQNTFIRDWKSIVHKEKTNPNTEHRKNIILKISLHPWSIYLDKCKYKEDCLAYFQFASLRRILIMAEGVEQQSMRSRKRILFFTYLNYLWILLWHHLLQNTIKGLFRMFQFLKTFLRQSVSCILIHIPQ